MAALPAVEHAAKRDPARLPVLLSKFVAEFLRTLVALKPRVVEGLHHEAVDRLSEVELRSAVRTGVVARIPLLNARPAAELVAVLALLWLFHHLQTNGARKKRVELAEGLLSCQALICLDSSAQRRRQLLQLVLNYVKRFATLCLHHLFIKKL